MPYKSRNALRLGLAAFLGASIAIGCNQNQSYPPAQDSITSNNISNKFGYIGSRSNFDKSLYVEGFKIGDRIVIHSLQDPLSLKDKNPETRKEAILDYPAFNDYLELTGNSKDNLVGSELYSLDDLRAYDQTSNIPNYSNLLIADQSKALAELFSRIFFYTDNHSLYTRDSENNIERARREDTDLFVPVIVGNKPYALGIQIDNTGAKADSLESRINKTYIKK
mgnify:CR=1 FL=1